ncbi:MAG: AAA family ATPase [bacterium]
MKKIAIVGCPSSGKTTMATQLGRMLNIPIYHLDKIFWTDDGHLKQDPFIAKQEEMMRGDSWIIDGNFMKSKSYEMRLNNADTIIFFAFPKVIVYWRLLKRGLKYFNKFRPDMGGKRRNHLNWELIKFIWNYPIDEEYKKVSEYMHSKNVIILHNLKEEREFLKNLLNLI